MGEEFSKTDIMYEITYNPGFVPRQFSKANVNTTTVDGEKKYFMKNHETGALYDLSEFGYDLWNLIDGKRTIKQIMKNLEATYKDLKKELMTDSLLFYAGEGLLEATAEPTKTKRVDIISAFMIRVKLIPNSNDFIKRIHRYLKPILRKSLIWPVIILSAIMAIIFAGSFISIFNEKQNFEIMGSTIVGFFFYYFVVLAPVIAVHEISHALALRHYGGAPREMGAGLYFFGPMFYVDVTDSWTLNKHQRIMIYAAGSVAEMLIASSIMITQFFWTFPPLTSHILTMVVFYCFYGILIDLSPLLETDGYFMLSDGLGIPDLRGKSFAYFKSLGKRLLGKPTETKQEKLTRKTKVILLVYAVLAAVWAIYLIYRSLTVASYMAQDTAASVLGVSSAIIFNNPLTISAIVLSVASVLYFGMVMSGYGLMIFVSAKKAFKTTLRLEEIHDRDFAVFLHLPKNTPKSLYSNLRKKMAGVARNFTRNFTIRSNGSMLIAVLRMSRTKLAFVQVKEHFRNIEDKFRTTYSRFLQQHTKELLGTASMHSSRQTGLWTLLQEMGRQTCNAGIRESEGIVSQVLDMQAKTALYLLHAVYGTVWTVELPPSSLRELSKTLLPTLLVEDLSVTNLYDDVENFKKRTIYGFDSLAKLACDNEDCLQDALTEPERYQAICSFEPVKNRLIFVGRTEQIENNVDRFGSLYACQAWCGYLDNLLSEVNLSLLSLNRVSIPTRESARSMSDGELTVLERNLTGLLDQNTFVKECWEESKKSLKCANTQLKDLNGLLKSAKGFEVGGVESALQVNAENMAHMPSQMDSFKTLYGQLYTKTRQTRNTVKKELERRKPLLRKQKRSRLIHYPFFVACSAILALLGVWMFREYVTAAFLISAVVVQASYWAAYRRFLKSKKTFSRYPSFAFRQMHFLTFALAESMYKFTTMTNLLSPVVSSTNDVTEPRDPLLKK